MRLVLCLLLVSLAMPAFAGDEWPYEAECRKWTDVPIPQEDIGTAPADCDAQALYYGIDGQGRGQDFVAARHCAYGSPSDGDSLLHDGLMFGGSGVLMMLFVNLYSIPMLLGGIIIYTAIYCASVWLLSMNGYEKALVGGMVRKVLRK